MENKTIMEVNRLKGVITVVRIFKKNIYKKEGDAIVLFLRKRKSGLKMTQRFMITMHNSMISNNK